MNKNIVLILAIAVLMLACSPVYQNSPKYVDELSNVAKASLKSQNSKPIKLSNKGFGKERSYSDPVFSVNAPKYNIDSKFKNIINLKRFNLPESTKKLLLKNGFAIYPSRELEYFQVYESNLYDEVPSFITTDSILHTYHIIFGYLMKDTEKQYLYEICTKMSKELLTESIKQYEECKNSDWSDAAKTNIAFNAVAAKLLDDKVKIPDNVAADVKAELSLIKAHKGQSDSPILGIKEDYTQYIPRSHYAGDPKLEKYFRALTWLGRASFSLKNNQGIQSAVLLTLAINNPKIRSQWTIIDEIVKFWVGESDNVTFYDINKSLLQIEPSGLTINKLVKDKAKTAILFTLLESLPAPKINSLVGNQTGSKENRDQQNKVFRLLGQRYTIDADIMQRLVFSEVQANPDGKVRMLPSGLDVAAAFGSLSAINILSTKGETKFANYSQNLEKMKTQISSTSKDYWSKNLYNCWMFSIDQLLEPQNDNYPMFMQSDAWELKELNTYLCSWAELKHDTQLYAKPVTAEAGYDENKDIRGYVEPNPVLYARLQHLLRLTKTGLKERNILSKKTGGVIELLDKTLSTLKAISIKELSGIALTNEEHDSIKFYGGVLSNIWEKSMDPSEYANVIDLNKMNAASVADIANTPDGQTLQVGNGLLDLIIVIVPVEDSLRIAVGGVGSYYEFAHPASERLTDQAWREMIYAGKEPKRPNWILPIIDSKIKASRSGSNDNYSETENMVRTPSIFSDNYN